MLSHKYPLSSISSKQVAWEKMQSTISTKNNLAVTSEAPHTDTISKQAPRRIYFLCFAPLAPYQQKGKEKGDFATR